MAANPVPLIVRLSADLRWFYVALWLLAALVWARVMSVDTCAKLCAKCLRIKAG